MPFNRFRTNSFFPLITATAKGKTSLLTVRRYKSRFTEDKAYMQFQNTTATRKIFQLRKRIRAVAGGTSASKTISILVWLIDYAQSTKNELISVVSESYPHLLGGAMLDFENIMKSQGYWQDASWVRNPRTVYMFETGSKIEFISVDEYGKAHGPRRDVLFINEANNLDYKIVDQLITRTKKIVWMDWNPSSEFWFYTEMKPNRDDIDFITLTYKDNEALDSVMVAEIEGHQYNKSWWQVYGLGQLGEVEDIIYPNWQEIIEVPKEARLERRYLDYGYTNDPTEIGDIYKWNDSWVMDELLYQTRMLNPAIIDFLKSQPEQVMVAADSAEPKSNDELALGGVAIIPALKGPDSVWYGIQKVQQQKIFYTARSRNIRRERLAYIWLRDRNGQLVRTSKGHTVPIGTLNHHMDGIRYGFESMLMSMPSDIIRRQSQHFERVASSQHLNSTK